MMATSESSGRSGLRTLIVADTLMEPLARQLRAGGTAQAGAAARGLQLDAECAPYGQVAGLLADASAACWKPAPDVLIVWPTAERALATYAALLRHEAVSANEVLAEVDALATHILGAAQRARHVLVVSLTVPAGYRGVQSAALRPGGHAAVLMQANLRLAERLAGDGRVVLLDAEQWVRQAAQRQRAVHDPKLYALGKIAFTRELFATAAAEMHAVLRGRLGLARKLIICDLDNTLWGGVLGDDGMDQLKLGGVDPVGESFLAVQQTLKALTRRGVLLAIASKNNAATAWEMIDTHDAMVLRRPDFVAARIDWNDKAQNIVAICRELNLGLDAAVFLDDSAVERDRVRQALPAVLVPELPTDPTLLAGTIGQLDCFESAGMTAEDAQRTALYAQEAARQAARTDAASLDDWLASLEIVVTATPVSRTNLARAAQLLNKTNQFNLATRRMAESELIAFCDAPQHAGYVYHVRDKFGDAGISAVVTVSAKPPAGQLVDFVMSCRVMGRRIEHAVLAHAVGVLREMGCTQVTAQLVPTARNQPAAEFFRSLTDAEGRFTAEHVAAPAHISLQDVTPVGRT